MESGSCYSANVPSRALLAIKEEYASSSNDEVHPVAEVKIEVDDAESGYEQQLLRTCAGDASKTPSVPLYRRTPYANQVMLREADKLKQFLSNAGPLYREGFSEYNQDTAMQRERYDALCSIQKKIEEDPRVKENPALLYYTLGYLTSLLKVYRCDDAVAMCVRQWCDDPDKYNNLAMKIFEYISCSENHFENHYFLFVEVCSGQDKKTQSHWYEPVHELPPELSAELPPELPPELNEECPKELEGGVLVDPFFCKVLLFGFNKAKELKDELWKRYLLQFTEEMGYSIEGELKLIEHCKIGTSFSDTERLVAKKVAEQYLIAYVLKNCRVKDEASNLWFDLESSLEILPREHCRMMTRSNWTIKDFRQLIERQQDNRNTLGEKKAEIQMDDDTKLEDVIGLIFDADITENLPDEYSLQYESNITAFSIKLPAGCRRWFGVDVTTPLRKRCNRVDGDSILIPKHLSEEKIKFYSGLLDQYIKGKDQIKDEAYRYAVEPFWSRMVLPNLKFIRRRSDKQSLREEFKKGFSIGDESLEQWLKKSDELQEKQKSYSKFTQLIAINMGWVLKSCLVDDVNAAKVARSLSDEGNVYLNWLNRQRLCSILRQTIEWMKECNAEDKANGNTKRAEIVAELYNINVADVVEYTMLYDDVKKDKMNKKLYWQDILDAALESGVNHVFDVVQSVKRKRKRQLLLSDELKAPMSTTSYVRHVISAFLKRVSNSSIKTIAVVYSADTKKVKCWIDSLDTFKLLLAKKNKLAIEKLKADEHLLLRTLLLDHFDECRGWRTRGIKRLLKKYHCNEDVRIIKKRLELINQYFSNESDDSTEHLLNIGFDLDEIDRLRTRYRAGEFIHEARKRDKIILRVLLDPEEQRTLNASSELIRREYADFHHSHMSTALFKFRQKVTKKTPAQIADFYRVSSDQVERWKAMLEQRREFFEIEMKQRKRKRYEISLEATKRIKLEAEKSATVLSLDENSSDKETIAGSSQSIDPLEGVDKNTKLTRVQFLDRLFGEGSRPLHTHERKRLRESCETVPKGVDAWLRKFKQKILCGDDEVAEHYGVTKSKARVWYCNRGNDDVDHKEADRAVLLAKFGQLGDEKEDKIIFQSVVGKFKRYNANMAKVICRKWKADNDVHNKNVDSVCTTYGFEKDECEKLLDIYHSQHGLTSKLYEASLSSATRELFVSYYEDYDPSCNRSALIRQYCDAHQEGIPQWKLAAQFSTFEDMIKKGKTEAIIANKMQQNVSDVKKWASIVAHKFSLGDQLVANKVKLFDRIWCDAQPKTRAMVGAFAKELGLDCSWAKKTHDHMRRRFDKKTTNEISQTQKLPLPKVAKWKAMYMKQKS